MSVPFHAAVDDFRMIAGETISSRTEIVFFRWMIEVQTVELAEIIWTVMVTSTALREVPDTKEAMTVIGIESNKIMLPENLQGSLHREPVMMMVTKKTPVKIGKVL